MVMIGQEVAFSFGFKNNTAKEGHFGREKVSAGDATAEGLCRLGWCSGARAWNILGWGT
jgi:hypothetical protein